jgi:hypothetical protein
MGGYLFSSLSFSVLGVVISSIFHVPTGNKSLIFEKLGTGVI